MKNMIDLRSDTVTKPTAEMLEAMMQAEVGDDVFGEDPTVRALEEKTAQIFGMEAGIFCPSGTMTNQIAIKILTQPQQEVICDKRSHIYNYEGGGIAFNSLCSVRLVDGPRGILSKEEIEAAINSDDIHYPQTALVALENTVNKGGGAYYTIDQIIPIADLCKKHQLPLHLDGARVFNALTASSDDANDYGKYFNTISVCLSKGLGAPVGSVLLGSQELIKKAKRVRKVLGGGMRQAGYLAAAGIYALDHHVKRLTEDHQKASVLADHLKEMSLVHEVLPVETNIVIFSLHNISTTDFLAGLKEKDILAIPFGKHDIRMVTHLEFDDAKLEKVLNVLKKMDRKPV
ncbi:threonine aldolase family protein [Catalinimonas niigatensis]|uniref:threonine aldolase family protein n=1 Tax=Catalinimonas niigatensis TaxID=1397264 RepID=UPI0026671AB6|nr:GntG family PLP-dependent aldolase [Catalinimonas niigatensis]WPP50572.1 GntG family PLP-dependent aldolase [Catalinimonas niigatensis]